MAPSSARGMAMEPDILLMDEPFAALDEMTRIRLNDDLLAWAQARNLTVVFVTHSVFEAVTLAQRIVVMAASPGRISETLENARAGARDFGTERRAPRVGLAEVAAVELQLCIGHTVQHVGPGPQYTIIEPDGTRERSEGDVAVGMGG